VPERAELAAVPLNGIEQGKPLQLIALEGQRQRAAGRAQRLAAVF
jgi:hypothetical protein